MAVVFAAGWMMAGGLFAFVWALGLGLRRDFDRRPWPWIFVLVLAGWWEMGGAVFLGGFVIPHSWFWLQFGPLYGLGPLLLFLYRDQSGDDPNWRNFLGLFFFPAIFLGMIFTFLLIGNLFFFPGVKSGTLSSEPGNNLVWVSLGPKIVILLCQMYILAKVWRYKALRSGLARGDKTVITVFFLMVFAVLWIGTLGGLLRMPVAVYASALALPALVFAFFLAANRYPGVLARVKEELRAARYAKSKIRDLPLETVLAKLQQSMDAGAWRDDGLSLPILAARTGLSTHQLSEIINEKIKKNFSQFVNEFRVDGAARQLLAEPERTILSVAFACGFNAKSTFNKAFFQRKGCTPQEYRRRAGVLSDNR